MRTAWLNARLYGVSCTGPDPKERACIDAGISPTWRTQDRTVGATGRDDRTASETRPVESIKRAPEFHCFLPLAGSHCLHPIGLWRCLPTRFMSGASGSSQTPSRLGTVGIYFRPTSGRAPTGFGSRQTGAASSPDGQRSELFSRLMSTSLAAPSASDTDRQASPR